MYDRGVLVVGPAIARKLKEKPRQRTDLINGTTNNSIKEDVRDDAYSC
jgi:hypothetical protein